MTIKLTITTENTEELATVLSMFRVKEVTPKFPVAPRDTTLWHCGQRVPAPYPINPLNNGQVWVGNGGPRGAEA